MKEIFLFLLCLLASPVIYAGTEEKVHAPYAGSAAFERLKTLEGNWSGTASDQAGGGPMKVSYEVSSGGSVLLEKLFADQGHEMVSVYSDEKGTPVMTHYCMLKNQPKLKMTGSDEKSIRFEWIPANGVEITDEHMHSLKVTFDGPDKFTQEWSHYENGKQSGEPTIIQLTRAKP